MSTSAKNEVHNRVLQTLAKIRPYLQADGGDVELLELDDNMVLKIKLLGTCIQCPYHMQTAAGVEQAILSEVPDIKKIITLQDDGS